MASTEEDEMRWNSVKEQFAKAETSAETIPMYDTWAEHYNEDVGTWGYKLDKHLDEFEDFVRIDNDSRILDVAAGTGLVGEKLATRGYSNIDGLDGSKGMLEFAKSRNIYKNYIHALLGPQPIDGISENSYDTLICVGALHPRLVNQECLEPLATITKPGGFIYVLTAVELLDDQRQVFENKMRQMQENGIWRWVLMKESPDKYYKDLQTLVYAFKVLK